MAKETRVVRTEAEVPDRPEVDPGVLAVRAYLVDGAPLDEEAVSDLEFRIKVQRLDRRGKVLQGVSIVSDRLSELFERVIEELGPGRYTFWCNYRIAGSGEKWRLIKAEDVAVQDPDGDELPETPGVVTGAAPPPTSHDILGLMLQQMNNTTQMMVAQQNAMTQVLVAALGRGGGSDGILEAIRTGAALAGRGVRGEVEEDVDADPLDRLINLGTEVVKLLRSTPDGATVPVEKLRTAAERAGVDEALLGQGLEPVKRGDG